MAALCKALSVCRGSAFSVLRRTNIHSLSTKTLQLSRESISNTSLGVLSNVEKLMVTGTSSFVKRNYGSKPPLDRQSISDRIMLVLRLWDKVDPEKIALESRFKEDLSLDSLDHVEMIMAMEDEFGFEIPDQDAEHLTTPAKIVQYVMDKEDVLDSH